MRAVAAMLCTLLASCDKPGGDADRPWALPGYSFDDVQPDGEYVAVQGTLLGRDVGYKVNTYTISCDHKEKSCRVADVEEIGRDQLGIITVVDWPVVTWTNTTIVAQDGTVDTGQCAQNTITLNRVGKTVSYDSIAKNVDKAYCQKFRKAQDYHWTIGQPRMPWEK